MNNFIFENKTKVYFGKGGVKGISGLPAGALRDTVMLAYGGGSIKRNGVYDEVMGILNAKGKRVVEFSGIMSNPTYAKVQEGAKLAQEKPCRPAFGRGRRQRFRLLQGRLRTGKAGRGHLGNAVHQAHISFGIHSARHHRHGIRHR